MGKFLRGWARVESWEGEEGIAEMQQAMIELSTAFVTELGVLGILVGAGAAAHRELLDGQSLHDHLGYLLEVLIGRHDHHSVLHRAGGDPDVVGWNWRSGGA